MRGLRLLACALLALGAGCAAEPARDVPTTLGANARIFFDGKEIERDGQGVVRLPIRVTHEYFQEAAIRLEEPRKPPLVADVIVLVNPPPAVIDRLVFDSKPNTTVVYTGEKGGSLVEATGPVALYPDPLSMLRDPDGPYLLPASGQGLVIISSDAKASVRAAGVKVPLRPAKDGALSRSFPAAVELPPGPVNVEIRRGGSNVSFAQAVVVRPGEWRLLCVHLGEERPLGDEEEGARRRGRPNLATGPAPGPTRREPTTVEVSPTFTDPAASAPAGEGRAPAATPAPKGPECEARIEPD